MPKKTAPDSVTKLAAPSSERQPASRPRLLIPIHPLFFALFPPLSLYSTNVGQVPWTDVIRPIALSLGFMVALYTLFGLALRSALRGAVVTSAILFVFFSYGHVVSLKPLLDNVLVFLGPDALLVNPNVYFVPLWCLVLLMVTLFTLRSKRDFRPINSVLSFVGLVMVLIPASLVATSGSRYPGIAPVLKSFDLPTGDPAVDAGLTPSAENTLHPFKPQTRVTPDIYYIILDAYGRQDVLKHLYDYNNEPFLTQMEKRGFYIVRRARPNYCQTILSISSSLNMTYLTRLAQKVGQTSNDLTPLHEMVGKNAAAEFLRTHGYQFVSISTGFGLTSSSDADLMLGGTATDSSHTINPYEGMLVDLTPLALVPRTNQTLYDQHRDALLAGFKYLKGVARLPYRKFVFCHILLPHPPFVFGPNGEKIDQKGRPYSLSDGSDWVVRKNWPSYGPKYAGQVTFVNAQILSAIDSILGSSKVRPVIIVQGDHGPRQFLDWHSLKKTNINEAFANLDALSLPDGKSTAVFYQSMTPVNTFRLLFDHLFDTHYSRLPDRSYYATLSRPYNYTDITEAFAPVVADHN